MTLKEARKICREYASLYHQDWWTLYYSDKKKFVPGAPVFDHSPDYYVPACPDPKTEKVCYIGKGGRILYPNQKLCRKLHIQDKQNQKNHHY